MTPPLPEQTLRLRLRAPDADDEPGYRRLLLSDEVGAWLRPPPLTPYTDAEVTAKVRRDIEHWATYGFGPWSLLDRASGGYVGRGGLRWTTVAGCRAVELPWSLLPTRWGEGLATEAAAAALDWARALGLDEVVSFTLTTNSASERVMRKIGLVRDREIEHAGLPHVLYRLALPTTVGP